MYRHIIVCISLLACVLGVSSLALAKASEVNAAAIDDLSEAYTVLGNADYVALDANAGTIQPGEPNHSCIGVTGQQSSVWFRFRAERRITMTLDTNGTYIAYPEQFASSRDDTTMSVYALANGTPETATFSDLWQVACNDDYISGVRYSQYTLITDPGMWYYVRLTPYYNSAIPAGSSFRLNIDVDNLVENGGFDGSRERWLLSGDGKDNDTLTCIVQFMCAWQFDHKNTGKSALKQVIDNFDGVKLKPGSSVKLSIHVELLGDPQKMTLKCAIFYTDGTMVSDQVTVRLSAPNSAGYALMPIKITKPVARIVVSLADKAESNGSEGWLIVDDVVLEVLAKGAVAREVSLAAPLAPKQ